MDELVLPPFVIDSINNGLIQENILNVLNQEKFQEENKEVKLFKNHQDYLLSYIKAYMVYVICGYVYDSKSTLESRNTKFDALIPYYFDNYIQLRTREEVVYNEVSIFFDILRKASLTDNDLRAMFLKDHCEYLNLRSFENSERFNELNKYDVLINRTISELGSGVFDISRDLLIKLSKCYILSKEDLSDSEYVCGSSSFLYNIICDAYSIYEASLKTFDDMISDRNNDIEKVQSLRRIIKKNRFYSGDDNA